MVSKTNRTTSLTWCPPTSAALLRRNHVAIIFIIYYFYCCCYFLLIERLVQDDNIISPASTIWGINKAAVVATRIPHLISNLYVDTRCNTSTLRAKISVDIYITRLLLCAMWIDPSLSCAGKADFATGI